MDWCDLPPYVDRCGSWWIVVGLGLRIVVDRCGEPWWHGGLGQSFGGGSGGLGWV